MTREEAEHALADVVAIARSGNFDALCSYQGVNQAMCERQLEFAGIPAPSTAPAVVSSRELRADPHPGLVLRLCGTKDSGEQYVSDLAVWRVDGKIEVQNPVYWSGTLIQELVRGRLRSRSGSQSQSVASVPWRFGRVLDFLEALTRSLGHGR